MEMQSRGTEAAVRNTLHYALGPFLVLARVFGVLPVCGVWLTSDVQQVRFRFCSLAVLTSLLFISCNTIDLALALKKIIERGLRLDTVGPVNFSVASLIGFLLFFSLARNWPNLIQQTRRCEAIFLQPCYASPKSQHFTRNIRMLGSAFLALAVVDHALYVTSSVYNNNLQMTQCNVSRSFWENYFRREGPHKYIIIKGNLWIIPFIELLSIAMTFNWNFADIILILACRSLALRYRQLHWRIKCHAQQHMHTNFWQELREDFLTLTELLHLYDDKLSGLVLLSCAHNMYFLCTQIFNIFQGKENFMNEIYFWNLLLLICVRLLTMMYTAATVHDAAEDISTTLYEIPTAFWCLELKRLNNILVSDVLALSGKRFFLLTRKLIIAMAGTILIYELAFIDRLKRKDEVNICAMEEP